MAQNTILLFLPVKFNFCQKKSVTKFLVKLRAAKLYLHNSASSCQISSKSLQPRPRHVSFNIMRVWLENACSRPFLFLGGTFPQMTSLIVLIPKRTVLGLKHVIWAATIDYFTVVLNVYYANVFLWMILSFTFALSCVLLYCFSLV